MHKRWDEMNPEEKADHLRGELRQMSSLYAMLSSQIQEVSRAMKTLQKDIDGLGPAPATSSVAAKATK